MGSHHASEGIFPLSIYLEDNFEFRISPFSKTYAYEYSSASVFRILSDIYDGVFFQTLSNFEQIGPNILLEFRKISLRIYTLITSRVLVSAPSSVIQTLDDF